MITPSQASKEVERQRRITAKEANAYLNRKPRSVYFSAALIGAITLCVIIAGALVWGAV